MKSNSREEIIDLSELFKPTVKRTESSSVPPPDARPRKTRARRRASASAKQKELPADEVVQPVSTELLSLLNHLKIIEGTLTQGGDHQRTAVVFKLVYHRALSLIEKIEKLAAELDASQETLRVALDTTGFALRHEIRRVYEVETKWLGEPGDIQFPRFALTRAYGLLQNCFQQSVITLAQVFNPTLEGNELFEQLKARGEESLILRRELVLLLQKAREITKESGVLQMLSMINSLKRFRQETMHFLMYRDWEEFEAFVDEVMTTYEETGHLDFVMNKFTPYLETLINHVNMRAVLNNNNSSFTDLTVSEQGLTSSINQRPVRRGRKT